jgi:hypothetical protein
LRRGAATRIVNQDHVAPVGGGLGMSTVVYSLSGFALALLTMVGCLAMLLGWFLWFETKLRQSTAAKDP